jgi:hypothetical protein
MPHKQTKSSKASGKLKLTKQTLKDLKLAGDRSRNLKGGYIVPPTAGESTTSCKIAVTVTCR